MDEDGHTVLSPRPNDLIAKHLGARAELDAAQDAFRAARTSPGTSIDVARNRILAARDGFRQAYQAFAAAPAFMRGQDAFGLSPDELGMQVGVQSHEHLTQMQTDFRSELMNRSNAIRDASNSLDLTLGSPVARARVDTLCSGNSGTANLFRTRDLEGQLARTQNGILGNS